MLEGEARIEVDLAGGFVDLHDLEAVRPPLEEAGASRWREICNLMEREREQIIGN